MNYYKALIPSFLPSLGINTPLFLLTIYPNFISIISFPSCSSQSTSVSFLLLLFFFTFSAFVEISSILVVYTTIFVILFRSSFFFQPSNKAYAFYSEVPFSKCRTEHTLLFLLFLLPSALSDC